MEDILNQTIFLAEDNKYFKWYWDICNRAIDRELPEEIYIEKHHIHPISIFGNNKNLVRLTAKEHYMVHLCLWQGLRYKYGTSNINTIKMAYAFVQMNTFTKNSKRYKPKTEKVHSGKLYSFYKQANHEAGVHITMDTEKRNQISKTLLSKSEEEWDDIIQKRVDTWNSKTVDEKRSIVNKRNETWNNRDTEYKKASGDKQRNTWKNKPYEEKFEHRLKSTAWWNKLDEDGKKIVNEKRVETNNNRSKEEKMASLEKYRKSVESRDELKSLEVHNNLSNAQKYINANMTDEQKKNKSEAVSKSKKEWWSIDREEKILKQSILAKQVYENMSDEDRIKRNMLLSEKGKQQWKNMTQEQHDELIRKRKETVHSKSPEYKAEIQRKRLATRELNKLKKLEEQNKLL